MLIILLILLVLLTAGVLYQWYVIRDYRTSKEFWKTKWRGEVSAHLETGLAWQERDEEHRKSAQTILDLNDSLIFWFEKGRALTKRNDELIIALDASERGNYEIEESYEMDRLTSKEKILELLTYQESYAPVVNRYFRLDKFHEETCVPLLSALRHMDKTTFG